jgi:hypothetical protein
MKKETFIATVLVLRLVMDSAERLQQSCDINSNNKKGNLKGASSVANTMVGEKKNTNDANKPVGAKSLEAWN